MNPLTVRLATIDDKSLLKMPPYSPLLLDALLCQEEVLIAEKDGLILGAVSVGHKKISYVHGEWRDEFDQCLNSLISTVSGGWISKLYILPEHRCQGIAKKLVTEAIDHLKKKNVTDAYAGINVKNDFGEVSEHLFKNNGFKRLGYCVCFLNHGNCRGVLLKKTIGSIE